MVELIDLEEQIREEKQRNDRYITNIETAFRKEFRENRVDEDEADRDRDGMSSLFKGIIGNHSVALSLFRQRVNRLI